MEKTGCEAERSKVTARICMFAMYMGFWGGSIEELEKITDRQYVFCRNKCPCVSGRYVYKGIACLLRKNGCTECFISGGILEDCYCNVSAWQCGSSLQQYACSVLSGCDDRAGDRSHMLRNRVFVVRYRGKSGFSLHEIGQLQYGCFSGGQRCCVWYGRRVACAGVVFKSKASEYLGTESIPHDRFVTV